MDLGFFRMIDVFVVFLVVRIQKPCFFQFSGEKIESLATGKTNLDIFAQDPTDPFVVLPELPYVLGQVGLTFPEHIGLSLPITNEIAALDHIVGASSFIPILVDYRANIDIAECRDAGNDIGEFSTRSSLKTRSAIKNNFASDPS